METIIVVLLIVVLYTNLLLLSKVKKISGFFDRANNDPVYEGTDDPLYEEAKKIVVESGKASAAYIQRRLRIGYARTARILDLLEAEGIVGPADGANPREILKNE